MAESWSGGCQCGSVRYAFAPSAILTLYCCHCRDCQRQSGSAFGMSLILPRPAFMLERGSLRIWHHATARGTPKRAHFCPECGNRIFNDGGPEEGRISVKAGTLDDPGPLRPVAHLWTRRRHPWLYLTDGATCHAEEPPGAEPEGLSTVQP